MAACSALPEGQPHPAFVWEEGRSQTPHPFGCFPRYVVTAACPGWETDVGVK